MDHQYRVKMKNSEGVETATPVTNNPKEVGEIYRHVRKQLTKGESVELQKREIRPWETVETSNG